MSHSSEGQEPKINPADAVDCNCSDEDFDAWMDRINRDIAYTLERADPAESSLERFHRTMASQQLRPAYGRFTYGTPTCAPSIGVHIGCAHDQVD
jgi:hypothetical protein